jgi:hypothetical protein
MTSGFCQLSDQVRTPTGWSSRTALCGRSMDWADALAL